MKDKPKHPRSIGCGKCVYSVKICGKGKFQCQASCSPFALRVVNRRQWCRFARL